MDEARLRVAQSMARRLDNEAMDRVVECDFLDTDQLVEMWKELAILCMCNALGALEDHLLRETEDHLP